MLGILYNAACTYGNLGLKNLGGAYNATIADGQAQATIPNDDAVCLPLLGCRP